jgi:hypothetical protein
VSQYNEDNLINNYDMSADAGGIDICKPSLKSTSVRIGNVQGSRRKLIRARSVQYAPAQLWGIFSSNSWVCERQFNVTNFVQLTDFATTFVLVY